METIHSKEHYQKHSNKSRSVAYFSMEIGLQSEIPTYSGGLGVLAGDTIKSFADLNVPVVAISLLYRRGYFTQHLNKEGAQSEEPVFWDVEKYMTAQSITTYVYIQNRKVYIRAYKYLVQGERGDVPVYFLDTDLEENAGDDKYITHYLYGGDRNYRLKQEIILGIGGVKILEALGYNNIQKYHMNEGHSALLTLELIRKYGENYEKIRQKTVFTTHTPVPAGHDQFEEHAVIDHLGDRFAPHIIKENLHEGKLNMTKLALNFSGYVNGVAKKHGAVSREMFPGYSIHSITNGIHAKTWMSKAFENLFDEKLPDWKHDPFVLRTAHKIEDQDIWKTHVKAKEELFQYIYQNNNIELDPEVFTIGFARRAATYKRGDLLFFDTQKLRDIHNKVGKIQIVFGGKAHPHDGGGKAIIQNIFRYIQDLKDDIKIVYLENYNMELGNLMTSGVDVWLNTPQCPKEASGTSGMKSALNGVLNFSMLDGWWIEGHIEHVTGWCIGTESCAFQEDNSVDAKDLYNKLENVILPTYYQNKNHWIYMMKNTISLNGSFFNTDRMVMQYVTKAYLQ